MFVRLKFIDWILGAGMPYSGKELLGKLVLEKHSLTVCTVNFFMVHWVPLCTRFLKILV